MARHLPCLYGPTYHRISARAVFVHLFLWQSRAFGSRDVEDLWEVRRLSERSRI